MHPKLIFILKFNRVMGLFSWFKKKPQAFTVDVHRFLELEFLFPNGQSELDEEFKKLENMLNRSGRDFFLPMLLTINGLFFLHHEVQENIPSIKNYILKGKDNVLSESEAETLATYLLERANAQTPEQKLTYVNKAMKRNLGM